MFTDPFIEIFGELLSQLGNFATKTTSSKLD